MKKQRIVTLLVLFLIVFALGTGYALSSKTLNIVGTANVIADDDNFIVRFQQTSDGNGHTAPTITAGKDTTATGDALAKATVTDDYNATISVTGLKKEGDSVDVTYTVENKSNDLDAEVTAAITTTGVNATTDKDYFTVTTTGITSNKTTIACDGTQTITVTVKLNKTPVTDKAININVKLTATAVEK